MLELPKTFSRYQTLDRIDIDGLKQIVVEGEGKSLLAAAFTNIPAVGRARHFN